MDVSVISLFLSLCLFLHSYLHVSLSLCLFVSLVPTTMRRANWSRSITCSQRIILMGVSNLSFSFRLFLHSYLHVYLSVCLFVSPVPTTRRRANWSRSITCSQRTILMDVSSLSLFLFVSLSMSSFISTRLSVSPAPTTRLRANWNRSITCSQRTVLIDVSVISLFLSPCLFLHSYLHVSLSLCLSVFPAPTTRRRANWNRSINYITLTSVSIVLSLPVSLSMSSFISLCLSVSPAPTTMRRANWTRSITCSQRIILMDVSVLSLSFFSFLSFAVPGGGPTRAYELIFQWLSHCTRRRTSSSL